MKLERLQISVFLGIAVLVWAAVLLIQGTSVSWEHARPFSVVVGVLVTLGLVFEHWLWRQRWLHGWFVKRPDLRGTWRVTLNSNYVRPGESQPVPPITCYMGVKQTLSTLRMKLMTPESSSTLIADHIRPSPNGEGYQIIGVYTNEPDVHLRDARISEMHQGTLLLETHGSAHRPGTITGKYWTDRRTIGSMEFDQRTDRVCTRFGDAHNAF